MNVEKINNKSIYHFLWSVIHGYRLHYFVMIMAPILGSFYDFANQYSLKLIVDVFSTHDLPDYQLLLKPVIIFIGAQILIDLIWRIADIAEWRSEPYVRQKILAQTYDHVQKHSYLFFQNTPSGLITSKIKAILDGYDNFAANLQHDFMSLLANSITLTFVLLTVSWKVFLFIFIWALVFFSIMYPLSKKMAYYSSINANDRHSIFGLISDNISNIFSIFSFSSRNRELKNLVRVFGNTFIPSNIRIYKFSFKLKIIAAILYWLMLIGLLFFILHLRRTNYLSTGDLVFVMGITLKMGMDLWFLVSKMQEFMRTLGDFKSAFSILQIDKNNRDGEDEHLPNIKIKEGRIVFKDVHFSYADEKKLFHDLNLEIQDGEKVGIVGSSGAGKTSLVSLLLKYFQLNAGSISVDNQNISHFNIDSLREQISVIPQDILLFHRNILENIRYGQSHASNEAVFEASQLANLHEFVMTLPEQYQTMVGERGVKLSGGQRQRIAIARAILKNSPILILDEATSSLDTETEELIQNSLNALLKNQKTTVIAIAHRLSTLKNMDRIIVLNQGKIMEQGTHEQLILAKNSFYKKLWDMQQI